MIRYLLLASFALSTPAQAHLLKLFTYNEAGVIKGSSYFAGEQPRPDISIEIRDHDGSILANLKTNQQGEFSYQPDQPGTFLVVADSGDGHQAQWTLSTADKPQADNPDSPDISQPPLADNISAEQLEEIVDRAVARQLAPLRLELQQSSEKAKLSDIVGGVGLIFGLAGMLMWWRSRQ